jgi:hypothetical protein
VTGPGIDARPPLRCSADGELLFRLERYEAADAALTAIGVDGAPIATFLRRGTLRPEVDIRDETSAPVARLEADGTLVEPGGRPLGRIDAVDVERDGWIDDRWTVSLVVPEVDLPLRPFALVALPLAVKVLRGRPRPVAADEDREDLRQVWAPS